ncbi:MAG: hypothetical protein DMG24_12195 [Acidobacteria bacterium]|nr:MAG: hypothetical protein DMG24_12195 [Acidobacteriota bacterium]
MPSPVHDRGVQFDYALGVGQAAVADAHDARIVLGNVDAALDGVKQAPSGAQDFGRALVRRLAMRPRGKEHGLRFFGQGDVGRFGNLEVR